MSRRSPRTLLNLAAGLALCAAFAPFSWYAVAPPLIAVTMRFWTGASRSRAFGEGWLFGFAYFGGSTYWVYYSAHDYGGAHPAAAVLIAVLLPAVLALYTAALAYCVRLACDAPTAATLLIQPSLWFVFEWLRGDLLSSFAWNLLGQSLIDSPLAGVLPVVGVYGAGWLTVFIGVALLEALRLKNIRYALAGGAAFAAAAAASLMEWTQAVGDPVRVAVLQADVPQSVRFEAEHMRRAIREYAEMTRKAPDDTLVLWPEAAVPAPYDLLAPKVIQPLAAELSLRGGALLGGAFVRENGRTYNSLFHLSDGEASFYHKRHLVPFGEYVPLRFLVEWVGRFVVIPMSNLDAGKDPPIMRIGGRDVGVSICYEATLTERIKDALPSAEYFVNVSNDGWFGDSAAPRQHLNMSRLRAAEFGRPMVRATTTGISAIINHRGETLWLSEQFVKQSAVREVQPRQGLTPYASLGHAPTWALAWLAAIWWAYGVRRRRRSSEEHG